MDGPTFEQWNEAAAAFNDEFQKSASMGNATRAARDYFASQGFANPHAYSNRILETCQQRVYPPGVPPIPVGVVAPAGPTSGGSRAAGGGGPDAMGQGPAQVGKPGGSVAAPSADVVREADEERDVGQQ
ncbi:Uncharacterized protein PBTT_10092 [Plasmodiophora brassicae]